MSISKTEKKFHRLYKTARLRVKCDLHSTLCDKCDSCEFYNVAWCYPYLDTDIILKLFILYNYENPDEIYEHWRDIEEFKQWLLNQCIYDFTPEFRKKVQGLFWKNGIEC